MSILKKLFKDETGGLLIYSLIFGSIAFSVIIMGAVSYAIFENKASNRYYSRDMALHVAEAGIEYYRWHLTHAPEDFQDGTGEPGPYVHQYTDKDGNLIGYFSLEVDPPSLGSAVVEVRSTGWITLDPDARRTIRVQLTLPSLSNHVFLNNDSVNYNFSTVIHGVIHSNGGIRFDGTTDSWVRSAKDRYMYEKQTHDGIWGGGGPKSFWQYPVPEIDFYSVTGDLKKVREMSLAPEGINLTSSGEEGWHIVFNTSTFDLYKVTGRDCYNGEGKWRNRGWSGWYWEGTRYCYDIGAEQYDSTVDMPENGVIFISDDVWVEGVVEGRVTLAVADFPLEEPYYRVYIPGDLTDADSEDDDVFGVMAQGEILVPYESPSDMTIEAVLLSQFSQIGTPFYDDLLKNSLTFIGSQISFESGSWNHVNGWGHVVSGFVNTTHTFDSDLEFFYPPGFPTQTTYEIINWEEI